MCGILGAIAMADCDSRALFSKALKYFFHLQHRGQDSAGVAYTDGRYVWVEKGFGLIDHVFNDSVIKTIQDDKPIMAIFQNRYATSDDISSRNLQPRWIEPLRGKLALVHNGNIPFLDGKKQAFIDEGVCFDTDNDTEFMLKAIVSYAEKANYDIVAGITKFMESTNGTYSAALMTASAVYLFRDPWGNRPLFLAKTPSAIYFASETCAFEELDSYTLQEVEPGAILEIKPYQDITIVKAGQSKGCAHCVFCNIYFARPDSLTFSDEPTGMFRIRLGRRLAELYPVFDADFVTYMPESGRYAAEGFALQSRLPIISAWLRNPNVRVRTFIQPTQEQRVDYSLRKHVLISDLVRDKIIVLIDDSIVRGTTIHDKVKRMRDAGAKEVHVRVSMPPIINPCYYGINMSSRDELIASRLTEDQIWQETGATSLKYLSLAGLEDVIAQGGEEVKDYCFACIRRDDYPIPLQ